MKKIGLILSILLSFNVYAQEQTSGYCGPKDAQGNFGTNCQWSLSNGVLKITGTGNMANFSPNNENDMPWYSYRSSIQSVSVGEGITFIGKQAFLRTSMTSISLPESLTTIGPSAFRENSNLTSIKIPDGVTTLSYAPFLKTGITEILLPDSLSTLGDRVFRDMPNGATIVFPDKELVVNDDVFLDDPNRSSELNIIIGEGITIRETGINLSGTNDLKIYCTGNITQCRTNAGVFADNVLPATATENKGIITYKDQNGNVLSIKDTTKKVYNEKDGSYTIYDKDGNFIGYKNKRIYTLDEANAVAGKVNSVKIRYR